MAHVARGQVTGIKVSKSLCYFTLKYDQSSTLENFIVWWDFFEEADADSEPLAVRRVIQSMWLSMLRDSVAHKIPLGVEESSEISGWVRTLYLYQT